MTPKHTRKKTLLDGKYSAASVHGVQFTFVKAEYESEERAQCFISQPQCSGLFQNCTCQESNWRPQLPPSNSLPSFLFLEALSSLIRPTPSYNTQALHEGSPSNKTCTSHLPQAPHKQNTTLLIIFHC